MSHVLLYNKNSFLGGPCKYETNPFCNNSWHLSLSISCIKDVLTFFNTLAYVCKIRMWIFSLLGNIQCIFLNLLIRSRMEQFNSILNVVLKIFHLFHVYWIWRYWTVILTSCRDRVKALFSYEAWKICGTNPVTIPFCIGYTVPLSLSHIICFKFSFSRLR